MIDIDKIDKIATSDLKDFQLATVKRVEQLYRNGQNRVLVADEVGMGKTLIARGVIAKTARIKAEEATSLFKVVYVCSNQNIARQNLNKLDINESVTDENIEDTRLSMQHLKITEQSSDKRILDKFIQLIPLTPETSFKMSGGTGNMNERALMYSILRRMPFLRTYLPELDKLMNSGNYSSWEATKSRFEERVQVCNKKTKKEYPANVINQIDEYDKTTGIKTFLLEQLRSIRRGETNRNGSKVIKQLRIMFARISVGMFDPGLVIMDEFQRFKFLLNSEEDSDMGILVHSFLDGENTRILLLSATPYKLYSTLEEIDDNNQDEHYAEFFQVMDFLFKKDGERFHEKWGAFSSMLKNFSIIDASALDIKRNAENAMYGAVCRTERISVMESGDYTDVNGVKHLKINENDIKSYLRLGKLLQDCGLEYQLPIDYVKSCPFLMSFMRKYKVKKDIRTYFLRHSEKINRANHRELWLNKAEIDRYDELPKTNARLELLKKKAFENNSEMYMWVPPARPYYDLQGVYRNSEGFSKILVFSSWEMVPRMIGTMISYEAERRTVGRLCKLDKNTERKNLHYFAEGSKRYPTPRLRFRMAGSEPKTMNMFCLLYPSKTLAGLYNPIASMNDGQTLMQIERGIKKSIRELLKPLKKHIKKDNNRQDERWYFIAPALMDGFDYVESWYTRLSAWELMGDGESWRDYGTIDAHINKLYSYVDNIDDIDLGKMPDDLVEILTNMVLGSPSVCMYRSNGGDYDGATILAKIFIDNFNSREATAIVELAYGKKGSDDAHWQNVLKYCKDGCFQAMIDEYRHMLGSNISADADKDGKEYQIYKLMCDSLKIHSATYIADTFASFKASVGDNRERGLSMHTGYAVGFTQDASDNQKNVNRKESVRTSFNSPLRPFVLATTSIGQEGLDFHCYCRKVMHWNLPGNPIDIEQREGRVNRYKCLAIRQNVAKSYGSIMFKEDIWKEMFEAAEKQEKADGQSDLVPFWCFGKNQDVKIERIVPMYPISKDEVNYERMIKILSLYRLTMGQPRQEELLDDVFGKFKNTDELKEMFINLSPFYKEKFIGIEENLPRE